MQNVVARTSILCTSQQTSAAWWLAPFAQRSSTEGRNVQLVPGCMFQIRSGLRSNRSSWPCTNRSKLETWVQSAVNNHVRPRWDTVSITALYTDNRLQIDFCLSLQPVKDFGTFFSAVIDDKVRMNPWNTRDIMTLSVTYFCILFLLQVFWQDQRLARTCQVISQSYCDCWRKMWRRNRILRRAYYYWNQRPSGQNNEWGF